MSTLLSKATLASAAALMLAGFTATAQGFFGPNSSAGLENQVQVRGKVVCTGCRLADVRQNVLHKHKSRLYQLILNQEQLVLEVEAVSNPGWLNNVLVPHLWIRGDEGQLQKLSAPETVAKEVEISGIVADLNMLNVNEVIVRQDPEDSNKLARQK
jgi:hypothetical protein